MSQEQSVKIAGNVLTVVIRDDSPLVHCNDGPSFRSVQITLTSEQMQQLELHQVSIEPEMFEAVSQCMIDRRDLPVEHYMGKPKYLFTTEDNEFYVRRVVLPGDLGSVLAGVLTIINMQDCTICSGHKWHAIEEEGL